MGEVRPSNAAARAWQAAWNIRLFVESASSRVAAAPGTEHATEDARKTQKTRPAARFTSERLSPKTPAR
jgi:hypothetical protein